jgi:hypothetical protein
MSANIETITLTGKDEADLNRKQWDWQNQRPDRRGHLRAASRRITPQNGSATSYLGTATQNVVPPPDSALESKRGSSFELPR